MSAVRLLLVLALVALVGAGVWLGLQLLPTDDLGDVLPEGTCRLILLSDVPGARAELDGLDEGPLPVEIGGLPPGEPLRLKVTAPGRAADVRTLMLQPGEVRKLEFALDRSSGKGRRRRSGQAKAASGSAALDRLRAQYRQGRFKQAGLTARRAGGETAVLADTIAEFAKLHERVFATLTPATALPEIGAAALVLDARIDPQLPYHQRIRSQLGSRAKRLYFKAYLMREDDPAAARQLLSAVIALLPAGHEIGRKARNLEQSLRGK